MLGDWFDNGRIDRLYPPHCYEEAIDAIPEDLAPYSDAEEVITRALQASLNGKLDPVGGPDPTPGDTSGTTSTKKPQKTQNEQNRDGGSDGSPQAAPAVDTSGPSSVPVPLIVLGGMSLALLAAGGLGYVSRRRQAAQTDDSGDDDTLL